MPRREQPKPEEIWPFNFLIEALQQMQYDGMDESEIVPAFVNFTATLAMKFGGETLLREAIVEMARRHKDYREGTAPPEITPKTKKTKIVTCQSCSRTVHERLSKRGSCSGCEELARMAGLRVN